MSVEENSRGSCVRLLLFVLATSLLPAFAHAQGSFQVLHTFTGPDGANPRSALVQTTDGLFYGTTPNGGRTEYCCGTVFRMTLDGAVTVLHAFTGLDDGANPDSALVLATDGNLYGTTANGGRTENCSAGCGTVFRMTLDGDVTVLHAFTGLEDGANPESALVLATDSNLYGTAASGGTFDRGTIFTMTLDGSSFTVLHEFGSTEGDGAYPWAALVQAADGDFYGTTRSGGDWNHGMIFRLSSDATLTELVAFAGHDGCEPFSGLIQTSGGNFYGTAGCGAFGWGVVFEMTPDGTGGGILHDFAGGNGDGIFPEFAGLLQATDGKFYGTTYYGGGEQFGHGTVFQLGIDGRFTVLYAFAGGPDGSNPSGALIQGNDGKLYGTTTFGGYSAGRGVVFRLALPVSP